MRLELCEKLYLLVTDAENEVKLGSTLGLKGMRDIGAAGVGSLLLGSDLAGTARLFPRLLREVGGEDQEQRCLSSAY